MDVLVGVDVGTSACKVSAIDPDGRIVSAESDGYGVAAPTAGAAEQDPEVWHAAVRTAVERLHPLLPIGRSDRVVAAFTGQMHTTVLLDGAGRPVRPAILWSDARSGAQCAEVDRLVPEYASVTGNPAFPALTLPHLLWVREHEPAAFARTRRVAVTKDLVRGRFTGDALTDWTDASATGIK